MRVLLERVAAGIQYILPQRLLSALVYRMMRIETKWVKNFQIRVIAKAVGVNWSEASSQDLTSYRHFNAFFTRSLKQGARNFDQENNSLLCPCDGFISELGVIDGNRVFQAKGQNFTLNALLADDPQCDQWRNGYFCTIYLSPRDYHRVHMPLQGRLKRMTHVPGRLFSVAPYTVRQVPGLFARNERVISIFETEYGPLAQILVGAMLVSSMETTWDGEITPSESRKVTTREYQDRVIKLSKGQEMGRFNMGSTVVVLLPAGAVTNYTKFTADDKVQLGQSLATLKA